MTDPEPFEFVDAHVHQWDLTNHPWYPALQAEPGDAAGMGLGDMAGMRRDFLADEYRQDAAGYRVDKVVHVSAATAPGTHLDESHWLESLGATTGWPAAIIGTVDADGTPDSWAKELDDQMADGPRFRGIRMLHGLDLESSRGLELLKLVAERQLVFDLVTSPGQVAATVPLLDQVPTLSVVVEHCGWPQGTDRHHADEWRAAMDQLAALGDRVQCKISGVAMVVHSVTEPDLRPWVQGCLDSFGVDRCFFGSNFPVDSLYGTYRQLLGSYRAIVAGLTAAQQRQLFVTNAERTYRI
jgi:L-fuconolactonase